MNSYQARVQKESKYFYLFSFLSILSPILAASIPFYPDNEQLSTWFQRSGSLMVVLALLAEARALNIHFILNPSGFAGNDFGEAKERYGKRASRYNLFSFSLIAAGTFIWGYGDLFY